MSDADGHDEAFAELAELLLVAHRRVRALAVTNEQKASTTKHLLAISDASKHDIPRALTRLRRLLEDLPDTPQTP